MSLLLAVWCYMHVTKLKSYTHQTTTHFSEPRVLGDYHSTFSFHQSDHSKFCAYTFNISVSLYVKIYFTWHIAGPHFYFQYDNLLLLLIEVTQLSVFDIIIITFGLNLPVCFLFFSSALCTFSCFLFLLFDKLLFHCFQFIFTTDLLHEIICVHSSSRI